MSSRVRSLSLAFVVNVLVPLALVAGAVFFVRPWLSKKKPAAPVASVKSAGSTGAPDNPGDNPDDEAGKTPGSEAALESVQVFALRSSLAQPKLQSTGVATPHHKMTVVPEVSGKVTWVSKDLVTGGRLRRGQTLIRLDNQDYKLKLRAQENQIAKAKLELAIEQERAAIAKRELALLERSKDLPAGTNKQLATRSHHLEVAKVAVDAAKSGLEQAQIQLQRTVIRAPFDAVVLSENAERGQVVGPSSIIATLIGAHELHVRAKVPVAALSRIKFQGPIAQRTQATVTLQTATGPQAPSWSAYADRLVHELDAQSMNAQVLFVVQEPFSNQGGKLPLLSNSLVNLEILGVEKQEVFKIPRSALVQGSSMWILDAQDALHKIPLQIQWSSRDFVYAQGPGLKDGTSALTRPPRSGIEGAKVKVLGRDPTTTAAKPAPASKNKEPA